MVADRRSLTCCIRRELASHQTELRFDTDPGCNAKAARLAGMSVHSADWTKALASTQYYEPQASNVTHHQAPFLDPYSACEECYQEFYGRFGCKFPKFNR